MKSHAPRPRCTDGEAANPGPNRRGPRCEDVKQRRKLRNATFALIADARKLLWETGYYNAGDDAPTANTSLKDETRNLSYTETMDARDKRKHESTTTHSGSGPAQFASTVVTTEESFTKKARVEAVTESIEAHASRKIKQAEQNS